MFTFGNEAGIMEIAFLFYSKFIHPEPFKVNASFKTNVSNI